MRSDSSIPSCPSSLTGFLKKLSKQGKFPENLEKPVPLLQNPVQISARFYTFLHFFTLFPTFFPENRTPASLQVCVPCTLQAEYVQKLLKGGISVRLQISFRIRPARLLLNPVERVPDAVPGQVLQGLPRRRLHQFFRVRRIIRNNEFPPLRDFCSLQRRHCPGCTGCMLCPAVQHKNAEKSLKGEN